MTSVVWAPGCAVKLADAGSNEKSGWPGWSRLKVAVTLISEFIVTLHTIILAVHPAPLQPPKVEPTLGSAPKATFNPMGKLAEHVLEQPGGLVPTTPEPLPAKTIFRVKVVVVGLKLATTDRSAFMSTVHTPVPVQSPLHPVNTEPAFG